MAKTPLPDSPRFALDPANSQAIAAELKAMRTVAEALGPLPPGSIRRVLEWAMSAYLGRRP